MTHDAGSSVTPFVLYDVWAIVVLVLVWRFAAIEPARDRSAAGLRRRRIARMIVGLYLASGLAAFTLTALAGYVLVSSVMAVAFQLSTNNDAHPESWATAFLSAGFAVLAVAAALIASLHHHSYIHHSDEPPES